MDRSEARLRLAAAEEWHARGLLDASALGALREELTEAAEEPGLAIRTFYALGGVLLAGATAALFVLLEINDLIQETEGTAWLFFAGWAAVFVVAAAALRRGRVDPLLADAITLGSLVIFAILLGPEPPGTVWLAWLAPVATAAVLAWRREAMLIALGALTLLHVGVPIVLYRVATDDVATMLWALAAFSAFAGAFWVRSDLRMPILASTTGAASLSWLGVIFEVIQPEWTGGPEVLFAMGVGILLAAGLLLRERIVALVAGLALTADVVVFAFDVGDVTAGLITLVVLGIGLIIAAMQMRRRA